MRADVRYLLALGQAPETGNAAIRALLSSFGSAEAVFRADAWQLAGAGISGNRAAALAGHLKNVNWSAIDRIIEEAGRKGIRLITHDDADYPELLSNIHDPPVLLYLRGSLAKTDTNSIAIVGTRYPTSYGVKTAERLGGGLAERGITVVSGLAKGIDAAAHKAAMRACGRTIAVLGCGVDVVYPPEHRTLYDEIAESGAIISEYPPGARPERWNFPVRNRIISGLSLGTVVVEAAAGSGSLITARYASEQGREVFAVPGPVTLATSKGANGLLKQGARLVEDATDVIAELSGVFRGMLKTASSAGSATGSAVKKPDFTGDELALLKIMGNEPKHIDEITVAGGLGASRTSGILLLLEMKGGVRRHGGMSYSLA
ncbi:MAG: DNA-protecting protein DprA [Nitrospirae bacterium]|nr:DNA-protecting protein DprA [Nitrospirota bacterium]